MKILFVARHSTYFRNFESAIRMLAERGHRLHLVTERDEALGGSRLIQALTRAYPGITAGEAPGREDDAWHPIAARLRLAVDFLRYLEPMYEDTPTLRARSAKRAPAFVVRFGRSAWSRRAWARRAVHWALRRAEQALPRSTRIEAYLRDQRPDVLLLTPLVGVTESPQRDYLRSAWSLGIPSALCVWSWDHLTSKALIRDMPDRVVVWNDIQRDEAVRLHDVPPDRVVVTGAQCFDRWFGRTPSRSREEFCAQMGLPADRPFVLYAGSALFRGSPPESLFALRWLESVRESHDPVLRSAGILVRPHPQRMEEWQGVDVRGFGDVAVYGGNPVTEQASRDYFDALYHCAAVVGLNTSAFLEAAIVGRPVLAVLPPEFSDNQEGTIHFRYLTSAAGGLLQVSRSLDEHVPQLARAVAGGVDRHEVFLQAFLRPHGLDAPATPRFVDAVEALAAEPVPARAPRPTLAGRVVLAVWRALEGTTRGRLWLLDAEELRSHERRQAKRRAGEVQHRQRRDEQRRKEAARAERHRLKRAQLQAWQRGKRQPRARAR